MPAADRRDISAAFRVCCRPFGAGVVVAFSTWGSRPRLYDAAPLGLDAWAAVAHAGLLLPFGARSVLDRGLLRRNHASLASPEGAEAYSLGREPQVARDSHLQKAPKGRQPTVAKDSVCRQQTTGTYRRHSGAAVAPSGLGGVVAYLY